MWPDVDVDPLQRKLYERRDRMFWVRRRVVRIRVGVRRIEQRFRGPEALRAKDLVVAVGELKGAAGRLLGEVFVRHAGRVVRREPAGLRPDLGDGLLEFVEEAVFLEEVEGAVWRGGGRLEGAVGGLRGRAGFDGGLGGDEVVGLQGDGGVDGGEKEAELLG